MAKTKTEIITEEAGKFIAALETNGLNITKDNITTSKEKNGLTITITLKGKI